MQVARQQEIMDLARKAGRVNVESLSTHFAVSPQTIRKDLKELSDRRLLDRVHGGAVIASSVQNLAYQARRLIAETEKREIGRAAAALVPSNSSLFVNIGTTTEEVARALMHHTGLLLITNNLHVASMLYPLEGIDIVIAGGPVRRSDGGVVGSLAVELIENFKVDFAIVGVSAIDADGALLDFDVREIQVAKTIMANARTVVLVADSSKFSRRASTRIGHLRDVDVFVTDKVPSPALKELCLREKVHLIETSVDWDPNQPRQLDADADDAEDGETHDRRGARSS
ncbi:MAG: DeoR/GlpR family DNA-binding transcription regulator [Alphaproteobacteria bacterium]|nr:DeoR/GlpR family DNA-binding transcription regulator [Alphaproteobacteria bacterium]